MLPIRFRRRVVYLTALELQIIDRFAKDLGMQRHGFSAALRFILQDWDVLRMLASRAPSQPWRRTPPLPASSDQEIRPSISSPAGEE